MQITKVTLDPKSSGAAALVKELVPLPVGVTSGRVEVSFAFTADKGADETYTAVQELCPWTLVAVLMNKVNGVTQDVVVECIPAILEMSEKQRKALRDNAKDTTLKCMEQMGMFVQRERTGKTRIEVSGEADIS